MALRSIPAISPDFPDFDWAGHDSSRLALISGGTVSDFRKETWNEIVSRLAWALAEAGFTFDPEQYRITRPYGPLTAEAFNAVRRAISLPAPLRWAWENDPGFEGYVGKTEFSPGDKVYASYLRELVRRLNLLLAILKDTAPFGSCAGTENLPCPMQAQAWAAKACPAEGGTLCRSLRTAGMLAVRIAYIQGSALSATRQLGRAHSPRGLSCASEEQVFSLCRGQMAVPEGVPAEAGACLKTLWAGQAQAVPAGAAQGREVISTAQEGALEIYWRYPVRLAGLHIPQAYGAVRTDNILEVR